MAKFKVLDGVFGEQGKGEIVELENEFGAFYVNAGLLEEVAEEEKPKRATKK